MSLMSEIDKRRERAAQDAENAARLAHAYVQFKTVGQGTSQYESRVPFGLTFIEKPTVGYCSEVDMEELADAIAVEGDVSDGDDDIPAPLCSGFVTQWDQDERDFYIGCWVAARVTFAAEDLVPPDAMPEVGHHFTFSAVGIKDIPPDQEDAVE